MPTLSPVVELYLAPFYLGSGDPAELPIEAWNGAIDAFTKEEDGSLFFPGWFPTLDQVKFQEDGTPDPTWFDDTVRQHMLVYTQLYANHRTPVAFKLDSSYVYYRYPANGYSYFVSHIAIKDGQQALWKESVSVGGQEYEFKISFIARIAKPA